MPVSRASNADYLNCEPDKGDTDWNDNDDDYRHDDDNADDDGGDSDGDNNDEQAAESSKIYSVHNCILCWCFAYNDY